MATHLTVEELIEAAKHLAREDRERLVRELLPSSQETKHRITELRGLGKEIWQGIDAQKYVDAERDLWER